MNSMKFFIKSSFPKVTRDDLNEKRGIPQIDHGQNQTEAEQEDKEESRRKMWIL